MPVCTAMRRWLGRLGVGSAAALLLWSHWQEPNLHDYPVPIGVAALRVDGVLPGIKACTILFSFTMLVAKWLAKIRRLYPVLANYFVTSIPMLNHTRKLPLTLPLLGSLSACQKNEAAPTSLYDRLGGRVG